jgi:hypothetical protein
MKALKIFGFVILGIVVVLALVGGYFGIVPGVSKIFAADKPKDLGVTYTEQDRLAGRAKAGWQLAELPAGLPLAQSLQYSGSHPVNNTFTDKELTAWINKSWNYIPFTDCQIRVNSDGTAEFSGILHTNRLKDYAAAMGQSQDFEKYLPSITKYLVGNPAVYIKAKGGVINDNVVNADIQAMQIGRYSVPESWLQDNANNFVAAAEWQIEQIPGLSINSLTFKAGGVVFDGSLPANISRTLE